MLIANVLRFDVRRVNMDYNPPYEPRAMLGYVSSFTLPPSRNSDLWFLRSFSSKPAELERPPFKLLQ